MLIFKKKNYLKRKDFVKLLNDKKIWSKSIALTEAKEILEYLATEISKYEFDSDKNFIMNSRRKTLKGMIEERLQKNEGNTNEFVSESLYNLFEFIRDEYSGNIISDLRELGISIKEFDAMDKAYRDKGIICTQEKDAILEMIQTIKTYVDERLK